MIEKIYADFAWEQTAALLAVDSPSGYTADAAAWVKNAFAKLHAKGLGWAEPIWVTVVFVISLLQAVSSTYNPSIYFNC